MKALENKFKQDMGARIRQIRKLRGLNQDELAAGIHLPRTSLVNMEKGRQGVTAATIYHLCQFLKISPADIFPDTPNSINILIEATIADLKKERDDWKNQYFELKSTLTKLKNLID